MDTIFEIKNAKISKRILGFLLDACLFIILLFSTLSFCETAFTPYNEAKVTYENKCLEHNLSFLKVGEDGVERAVNWTYEEFLKSSYAPAGCDTTSTNEDCEKAFNDFYLANNESFGNDEVAVKAYETVINYRIGFYAISAFFALFIINVFFPLIFKNGQTLGKKAMRTCLVTKESVRVSNSKILIRFFVGIFLIEVLPLMLYLAAINIFSVASVVFIIVAMVNFCMIVFTRNHSMIHDLVAGTVVACIDTTVIFNSLEEKKRIEGNAK